MPLVSFDDLMAQTRAGGYAVGYFESWDMISLMAVADAAKDTRSPVLLGFSGLYLSHPARLVEEPLSAYAAMGLEVCRQLPVPAALVYNESPDMASVLEAARLGFSLVMYSDENLDPDVQRRRVREVAEKAHRLGAAVEGEIAALPGLSGMLAEPLRETLLTDIEAALEFVAETKVDALAVNLGQMHLHGRRELGLDLDLLGELRHRLSLPLVLHGASSVRRDDLQAAIKAGIGKINVGSLLKQTYFEALRSAGNDVGQDYNPYVVIGSGLEGDVQVAARQALQDVVAGLMRLFGSAGRA
jgi:fructose/tagatose bisphosphate aldolase